MEEVVRWLVGVLVSVLLGHLAASRFVYLVQRNLDREDNTPWREIPYWLRKGLMGVVERLFFTVAIGADLSGTVVAMVGWTALKGTLYWTSYNENYPAFVLVAILGSLVSLLFAIIGGMICKGPLWNWALTLAA